MKLYKWWEIDVFLGIAIVSGVLLILSIMKAWLDDRRRWRHIQPHYGSVYDASACLEPRENVRGYRIQSVRRVM